MFTEIIAIIVGIIITWLVFTWAIKVLKTSISTAIAIAIMLLILQLVFGIGYPEVWQELEQLIQHFIS